MVSQVKGDRLIAEKINEIYGPGGEDSSVDPVMEQLQAEVWAREENEWIEED